jgi:ABC-type nitrate/sulfonate/bicarbonate transport system substrate-binding protein
MALVGALLASCAATTNAPTASPAPTATSATSAAAAATAAPLQAATLNVGRFPKGSAAAFVTQYMINNKLVEEAGKSLGLDVKVNWTNMANAVAVAQALAGGTLDIGPMGSSAYVGLVAQNQQVTPISLAEGHFKVLLVVRNDSPIHNLADLKGKTVGTITGTDLYNVLAEFLLAQFGTADPGKAGVQIANIGSVPQLATVPTGVDASIVTIPSFLQAQALGLPVKAVVNSYGMSEDGYDGPEGKGAGLTIETAKKSPFWPDGFYGHRAVFVARDAYVQQSPKAVQAFLMAQAKALKAIQAMSPREVAALVEADWGIVAVTGQQVVKDDLLTQRGFAFMTEGDAAVLYLQAKLAAESGATASVISWDTLKAGIIKGATVAKAAYDASGQQPPSATFLDTSKDVRGYPTWEAGNWKTH